MVALRGVVGGRAQVGRRRVAVVTRVDAPARATDRRGGLATHRLPARQPWTLCGRAYERSPYVNERYQILNQRQPYFNGTISGIVGIL